MSSYWNKKRFSMKKLKEDDFESNIIRSAYFLSEVGLVGDIYTPSEWARYLRVFYDDPLNPIQDDIGIYEVGTNANPQEGYRDITNYYDVSIHKDKRTLDERIVMGGNIQAKPAVIFDNQQLYIGTRRGFISDIHNLGVGMYYVGGITLIGLSKEGKGGLGHANAYIIHKLSAEHYIFQRFEPNYSSQRFAFGISSLMNIFEDDHVNQVIINELQSKLTNMLRRQVTVKYSLLDTGCPNIGFQIPESLAAGSREEKPGYCLYWSMAVIYGIIELKKRQFTGGDILSESIKNLNNIIEAKPGQSFGEKAKIFIREWASNVNYKLIKRDALIRQFPIDSGWKFIRFVRNTIPYSHAAEVIMR